MSALYLSRVTLRPRPTGGGPSWSKLRDVHELHRALWEAFSAHNLAEGTPAPFLFRADRVRVGDEVHLRALVQSELPADFSKLGESVLSVEGPRALDAWLDEHAREGSVLRFFLRANVTRSVKRDGDDRSARGKRVAIESEAKQRAWLLSRAEKLGLRVCEREAVVRDGRGSIVQRTSEPELRTSNARVWRWGHARSEQRGVHQGVDFEGLIEVVNAAALRAAVESGVGPAKGLGFGLLSLAALKS